MNYKVSVVAVLAVLGSVGVTGVNQAADVQPSLANDHVMIAEQGAAPMVGMPSPMHEFATIDEAARYMNIDPQLPKVLPVGYNIESITTINKDILQIIYVYQPGEDLTRNQANGTRINYRVSKDKNDISGDYNNYNVTATEKVNGTKVTFKGGQKMVYLAMWQQDGQNHAIAFERPVTRDMAKAIIANVKVTQYHSAK